MITKQNIKNNIQTMFAPQNIKNNIDYVYTTKH